PLRHRHNHRKKVEIADGGAFRGAEDDFDSGACGSQAVEQGVLVAAAYDEEAFQPFSGDCGDGGEDLRVTCGEAVKDEVCDSGDAGMTRGERSLTEAACLLVDFVQCVARE